MKKLRNFFILFLALSVFYSASGHSIVQHYCKKMQQCAVECCSDLTSCCSEVELISTTDCCSVIATYYINPFSVKKPDDLLKFKIDIAPQQVILLHYLTPFLTIQSSALNFQGFTLVPHLDFFCILRI